MTRIRFRTDAVYYALWHFWIARGKTDFDKLDEETRRRIEATPPALPGDIWRLGVHGVPGAISGYAICCPKCRDVHFWSHAHDCARDATGQCAHERAHTSCWTWSGSAEAGTLSASPSLWCKADLGGCGWHGFLTNGVLNGA